MTIPKIFMQTLFGFDSVPPVWTTGFERVGVVMPSYTHVLLHGREYDAFVSAHFPDFIETFRAYPHEIQRCDAVRYMWLYVHGGVYMDLDMELTKDIAPLISGCDIALAQEIQGTWYTHSNCLMASRPRHPFWLDCISLMKRRAKNWYPFLGMRVTMTTGPGIVSSVWKSYRDNVCTIPRNLVNSCALCHSCVAGPDAFVRPLPGGSWMHGGSMAVWCARNRVFALAAAVVVAYIMLNWRVTEVIRAHARS